MGSNTQTVGSNQATGPGGSNQTLFSPYSTIPIAQPTDNGQVAWTVDPQYITVNAPLVSGDIYFIQMRTTGGTIHEVATYCGIVASGLVANECFIGLYTVTGTTLTLLALTADISTLFGSVGYVSIPIGPVIVPPGYLYAAVLFNGTTPPNLRAYQSNFINFGCPAGTLNRAMLLAGQTSLPGTQTMISNGPGSTGLGFTPLLIFN